MTENTSACTQMRFCNDLSSNAADAIATTFLHDSRHIKSLLPKKSAYSAIAGHPEDLNTARIVLASCNNRHQARYTFPELIQAFWLNLANIRKMRPFGYTKWRREV